MLPHIRDAPALARLVCAALAAQDTGDVVVTVGVPDIAVADAAVELFAMAGAGDPDRSDTPDAVELRYEEDALRVAVCDARVLPRLQGVAWCGALVSPDGSGRVWLLRTSWMAAGDPTPDPAALTASRAVRRVAGAWARLHAGPVRIFVPPLDPDPPGWCDPVRTVLEALGEGPAGWWVLRPGAPKRLRSGLQVERRLPGADELRGSDVVVLPATGGAALSALRDLMLTRGWGLTGPVPADGDLVLDDDPPGWSVFAPVETWHLRHTDVVVPIAGGRRAAALRSPDGRLAGVATGPPTGAPDCPAVGDPAVAPVAIDAAEALVRALAGAEAVVRRDVEDGWAPPDGLSADWADGLLLRPDEVERAAAALGFTVEGRRWNRWPLAAGLFGTGVLALQAARRFRDAVWPATAPLGNTVMPPPTDTVVPLPTDTVVPLPTDTVVPPLTDTVPPLTDTVVPPPTDTVVPLPTDTVVPLPTDTVVPPPTDTVVPVAEPPPVLPGNGTVLVLPFTPSDPRRKDRAQVAFGTGVDALRRAGYQVGEYPKDEAPTAPAVFVVPDMSDWPALVRAVSKQAELSRRLLSGGGPTSVVFLTDRKDDAHLVADRIGLDMLAQDTWGGDVEAYMLRTDQKPPALERVRPAGSNAAWRRTEWARGQQDGTPVEGVPVRSTFHANSAQTVVSIRTPPGTKGAELLQKALRNAVVVDTQELPQPTVFVVRDAKHLGWARDAVLAHWQAARKVYGSRGECEAAVVLAPDNADDLPGMVQGLDTPDTPVFTLQGSRLQRVR